MYFPCYQGICAPRPVRRDCVVSHAFPEFGDFAMTGAKARIPWAFAGAEIGDRRNGSVTAVLRARSPMPIFQSPELPGGAGRDRFRLA